MKEAIQRSERRHSGIVESADSLYDGLLESCNNYDLHAKLLKSELSHLSEAFPEQLRFGPKYYIETSRGEPLTIFTTFYDMDGSDGDARRDFILIAEDSKGSIVGDEYQKVMYNRKLDFVDARHLITTGAARGAAIPIDLVAENLLQEEANRWNVELQWNVTDANIVNFKEAKRKHRRDHSSDSAKHVDDFASQRPRWEALYGPGGKLGFGKRGQKVLMPNGPAEDLESVSAIALERVDHGSAVTGQVVSKLHAENKNELREERFRELRELVRKP